jgi:PhnB protein
MPRKPASGRGPVRTKKKPLRRTNRQPANKKVASIPKGLQTVAPYLVIANCANALAFYAKAFGAKALFRLSEASGRIGHAEMRIGDSVVMMSDEYPEMGMVGPGTNASPVRLHLAVKNVDTFVRKAVAAGAKLIRPVQDQFYGSRSGVVSDPFGYSWIVGTQTEVISPKTMQKRWDQIQRATKQQGQAGKT